jgi:hypothetical protein
MLVFAGSDTELLRVRDEHCINALLWLSMDSQMLATSAWIYKHMLMGVRPPLASTNCAQIMTLPAAERNAAMKDLNLVDGVELFMASSAGCACHMDVALFWNGQNDSKSADGGTQRVKSVIRSTERCSECTERGLDCVATCRDCERKEIVCERCDGLGIKHWSHLRRPCFQCHQARRKCLRCTVLGVVSDQEPRNVSTFNALRQEHEGPGNRLLGLVHDPYHQVRGLRNALGGYFLEREGEWFCASFILVIRCGNNKQFADSIIAHCSESALLAKDKHSMDYAMILFRAEIEKVLSLVSALVQTLFPCPYRSWLQSANVGLNDPRYVVSSRNRNLWVSCPTYLVRCVPSFPIKVTKVAGVVSSSESIPFQRATKSVSLKSVRFRRLTGVAVVNDAASRVVLLCADADSHQLLSLHIQFKVWLKS